MKTMKLEYHRLKPDHAAIVPYLRKADVEEIEAFTGLSPAVAVSYSIATSERGYAVVLDGRLCVIFGVAGGVIWLVGTDAIAEHPVKFYRVSRKLFPELSKGYSRLENYVDARNVLSLRWLHWLGFKIGTPERIGLGVFHHVVWTRKDE